MSRLDETDSSPFRSSATVVTASESGEPARPIGFTAVPYVPIILTLFAIDFLAPMAASDALNWSEVGQAAAGLFAAGLAIGQIVLLSLWTALGPEPWYWRLPGVIGVLVVCLGLALLGCWTFGLDLPRGDELVGAILMLPLGLCAAQAPAWSLRLLGQRRIVARHTPSSADGAWQFRIRHLFGATAMTAIVLGSARMGASWGREPLAEDWITAGLSFLGISIVSAFYTLPGIWIVLGSRNPWLAAAVAGGLLGLLGGGFAVTAAVYMGIQGFLAFVLFFSAYHTGLMGVLLGGLIPFRMCGFLLRPRREG